MGMFDYLYYKGKEYQTKDTPDQFMETYELRDDGLWYKDTKRKWVEQIESLFGGHLEEVSHEWKRLVEYDGLIRFYDYYKNDDGTYHDEEWRVVLCDGNIIKLEQVK